MVESMVYDPSTRKRFRMFYKVSPLLYNSAHTALERAKNISFQAANVRLIKSARMYATPQIISEFDKVYAKLEQNRKEAASELSCPVEWAISKQAGLMVYALVRKMKPETVLETGVANGVSTYIILSALNKNEKGELVSVEIRRDIGRLVTGINKRRWHLKVGNPKTIFAKTLKHVVTIDIFLHDSDHSYKTMRYEYNAVLGKLSKNGVILSDDVNGNAAFMEFAKQLNAKPILIRSKEKVFGVLQTGRQSKRRRMW